MPFPPIPASHLAGPSEPERKSRFMELVRRCMRERHYSSRTEQAYLHWIRRFIVFHGRRHPEDLAEVEVAAFLSSLAVEARVAASTHNQALAALTFLYEAVLHRRLQRVDRIAPARRARHLPVVLTRREIRGIVAQLREPFRLCVLLMYGS